MSWKKIKKSGSYYRRIKQENESFFKRANELATEVRQKQAARAVINHPEKFDAPLSEQINKCNMLQSSTSCSNSLSADLDLEINNNATFNELFNSEEVSGGEDEIEKNHNLRSSLKKWAIKYGIHHAPLNELMQIINTRFSKDVSVLPRDARTLLETPLVLTIEQINGKEEYWHYGFKNCLQQTFADLNESMTVSVNINIDGLPIFNSSKVEFWPILFNITEIPQIRPMVIGIFCGKGKSSDMPSFLTPFVDEANEIIANGLVINSHKLTVTIRCFICDSPARSFVKGVANFNAHLGCGKCTTIGEYNYDSKTNVFPRTVCDLRTDEKFRMKFYGSHHKIDSPLMKLNIDMIEQFPVGDALHLLHLGVMKRLLLGWRDGSFRNSGTKWPAQTTNMVSQYLIQCQMPAEFHRKVRGLDCLSFWKGTEFRTFLHYIGIVVLKDHLPTEAYNHFLMLFCVVTICTSKQYFSKLPVARKMILLYIDIFAEIYGEQYMTSNVHNLAHLIDEVERFGELDSFSAYPFESLLGRIKRMLRNGNRPLAQIAKRIIEDSMCLRSSENKTKTPSCKFPSNAVLTKRNDGEGISASLRSLIKPMGDTVGFFSKAKLADFQLANDQVNCWFLTNENGIARITNIIQHKNNHIQLCCIESQAKYNFFSIPIESKHFNIYSTHQNAHIKEIDMKFFDLSDVMCKLVRLPYHDQYVFIPLLHTYALRNE